MSAARGTQTKRYGDYRDYLDHWFGDDCPEGDVDHDQAQDEALWNADLDD